MDITLVLVTLLSLTLAAVMTTLAWRLAREERRRSDARVALLAAEIRADDLVLRQTPVATGSDLFAAAQPTQSSSRLAAVLATGVVVVGSAAALVVVLSGSGRGGVTSAPVASGFASPAIGEGPLRALGTGPSTAPGAGSRTPQDGRMPQSVAPLELVALTHERDADRLTVRGVVRNPRAGAEVNGLTAVVFLFNRDGGFAASGRAAVDAVPLVRGMEAPFAVTIPGTVDVGRYRVSFRTDERVVPHVDRRDRAVAQLKQP
jgi:hypothetical protein